MLTEQIGFRLFLEGRLEHAGPGAADRPCIRQPQLVCVAGVVLMDGDEARNTAALGVGAPHQMAGTFGSDHEHVDVLRRVDGAEVDVEAVGEHQRVAGLEVGSD